MSHLPRKPSRDLLWSAFHLRQLAAWQLRGRKKGPSILPLPRQPNKGRNQSKTGLELAEPSPTCAWQRENPAAAMDYHQAVVTLLPSLAETRQLLAPKGDVERSAAQAGEEVDNPLPSCPTSWWPTCAHGFLLTLTTPHCLKKSARSSRVTLSLSPCT